MKTKRLRKLEAAIHPSTRPDILRGYHMALEDLEPVVQSAREVTTMLMKLSHRRHINKVAKMEGHSIAGACQDALTALEVK